MKQAENGWWIVVFPVGMSQSTMKTMEVIKSDMSGHWSKLEHGALKEH